MTRRCPPWCALLLLGALAFLAGQQPSNRRILSAIRSAVASIHRAGGGWESVVHRVGMAGKRHRPPDSGRGGDRVQPASQLYYPLGMAAGPDGAMWFTENGADKIGRITTSGDVTKYPPALGSGLEDIALRPDGALWFTEGAGNKIGRITTLGALTEYALARQVPRSIAAGPNGIVAGPDGAVWFTDQAEDNIGRINHFRRHQRIRIPTVKSCLFNRLGTRSGAQVRRIWRHPLPVRCSLYPAESGAVVANQEPTA
jgi:streptogramin lyase